MPAIEGRKLPRAREILAAAGLGISIKRVPSAGRPGRVITQDPASGSEASLPTVVNVTVAEPFPLVPSVMGSTRKAAVRSLQQAGFRVSIMRRESSAAPGTVLAQKPSASARLKPGRLVTITVAKAPAPSQVCTPGYSPCLPPASDYDCAGGSGNGPAYTGRVTVTGSDPYGLDADGDGIGCD